MLSRATRPRTAGMSLYVGLACSTVGKLGMSYQEHDQDADGPVQHSRSMYVVSAGG